MSTLRPDLDTEQSVTDHDARYQPGGWVCASSHHRWLLAELPPDHPTVQKVWHAISTAGAREDILDLLLADGVRAMPSFALLWLVEPRRVYVRGTAKAVVKSGEQSRAVICDDQSHWITADIEPGAFEVILSGAQETSGPDLPMAVGVTFAARVAIDVLDLRQSPAPPAPAPEPVMVAPEPATEGPPVEAVPDDPPQQEGPVQDSGYDHLFGETIPISEETIRNSEAPVPKEMPPRIKPVEDAAGAHRLTPEPEPDVTAEVDAQPQTGLIDAVPWLSPASESLLSEETIPISEAPVPVEMPPRIKPVEDAAGAHRLTPEPEPDVTAEVDAQPQTGLIDAVPWLSPASESPLRSLSRSMVESVPWLDSAETERTVDRGERLADLGRGALSPTVLASRCPMAHLTPAHLPTCRVCGLPVPAQEPVAVARPPLGVLRLSTGDTVTLDRGVRIGRKPEAPPDAVERPHLVRVSSPENDVSRQHAEIVLDGWQVYVRDLGSANGTTVALPGQAPQRLLAGELQLLENGAAIVIADEIHCVFEVTP